MEKRAWLVAVTVSADATIYVDAESEQEAIEKAFKGDWTDEMDIGTFGISSSKESATAEPND